MMNCDQHKTERSESLMDGLGSTRAILAQSHQRRGGAARRPLQPLVSRIIS
jgi:hypothetical protein